MKLNNVFLAIGPEPFLLSDFIKRTRKAVEQKYGEFAVQLFSYPSMSLSSLRAECFAPAFLSEKRVLFCYGLPWSASDKIKDEEKDALIAFANSLSALPEDVVLYFVSENPDKRTKFFKLISESAKDVKDFPQWDTKKQKSEYIKWIQERAQSYNTTLSSFVADALFAYCGSSLSLLDSEIQKLSFRRQSSSVPESDIAELCVPGADSADYAFSNALSTANIKTILSEVEILFEDFSAAEVLNKDIIPAIRNLLKASLSRRSHEDFGLHPFVIKNLSGLLSQVSENHIMQCYSDLRALDIGTKTGKYSLSPDSRSFVLALETALYRMIVPGNK